MMPAQFWPDEPCPVNKSGYHSPKMWVAEADEPAGFSCPFCHKTWESYNGNVFATWDLMEIKKDFLHAGIEDQLTQALCDLNPILSESEREQWTNVIST